VVQRGERRERRERGERIENLREFHCGAECEESWAGAFF
jgi:hypothetical protein